MTHEHASTLKEGVKHGYVPVVRHFRNASEAPQTAAERQLLRDLRPEESATWRSLITPDEKTALVLLAASGTGKTTELTELVASLRARQLYAVWSNARSIVAEGFEPSLTIENAKAFSGWQSGTAHAVVVVDAVDEIHLDGRTIRDLIRRLERALDLGTRSVQLVLCARNGAWSTDYTWQLTNLLRQATAEPKVRVVTFDPIDRTALSLLVQHHGVADVATFLRAFEEDELDGLLELRPCDVRMFTDYWRRHGRFGTWREILSEFVNTAIDDPNRSRERHQTLTGDEARAGLARLAATTIVSKTPHVAVPAAGSVASALSSRRIFDDWPSTKITELFENPLFVHKGVDAVQLPQGAFTHFLAARWLADRTHRSVSIEALRSALVVRVHDDDEFRLPDSRRAVAGWAASESHVLREFLLRWFPDVALYEGDPDRLADHEVGEALERHVANLALGKPGVSPTRATARKLARPSLEQAVVGLLRKYARVPEVQYHLLRLAEVARYAACVPEALALALDSKRDIGVRAVAISVVGVAGDQQSKRTLTQLLHERDDILRGALLQAVARDLEKAQLIDFIAGGGETFFCHAFIGTADALNVDDLDALIDAVLPSLESSTEDADTANKFNIAVSTIVTRLQRDVAISPSIVRLLCEIERMAQHAPYFLPRGDRVRLDEILKGRADLRRALWQHRLLDHTRDLDVEFGDLSVDDLDWVFDVGFENGQLRPHIRSALDSALIRVGPQARDQLKLHASRREFVNYVVALEERQSEFEEARVPHEQERLREEAGVRDAYRVQLEPLRSGVESGLDLDALCWAWGELSESGTGRYARLDLARLARLVGDDWLPVFAQGFKSCWRGQRVELPQPGVNGKPTAYLAGLTGITLEIRDGLSLVALSAHEAELATRYAMHELNAFPFWFDDLVVAQPSVVRRVLDAALCLEWAAAVDHLRVIQFAASAPMNTRLLAREVIIDLLEHGGPAHARTAHYAVDVLIAVPLQAPRIEAMSRREVLRSTDSTYQSEWLRAWAHLAPVPAAKWLQQGLRTDETRFSALVMRTAELLEHDVNGRFGETATTALMAPRALAEWANLLHRVVRPEEDRKRRGVTKFGTRDHAEDFRRRSVDRIAEDTTLEGRNALRWLRERPWMASDRARIDRLLEVQAQATAEATISKWSEGDVLSVERGDEKQPSTADELFRLVQAHVRRVGILLENDDFSYRRLFQPTTLEREIQLWVASSLRQVARGLYSVIRENAVDDDKEVDISAFANGVGRVPIEIKPLNKKKYTFEELRKVIDDQLVGRYMRPRDVRHGILLLVLHEARTWRVCGKATDVRGLVEALSRYASRVGEQAGKVITVELIDTITLPRPESSPGFEARPRQQPRTRKRP